MSHNFLTPRPNPKLLSIVIPFYNEEEMLPVLRPHLTEFLDRSPYPCEVIAVNDGSSDRTLDLLIDWCEADSRIKVLNLSRNFGHQYASTAGIDHASGDAIVLMDSDLQDPLEVVHQMVEQYRNGYDVVCGQRVRRAGEGAFKKFTAWVFLSMHAGFLLEIAASGCRRFPAYVATVRRQSRGDAGTSSLFAWHGRLGGVSTDLCSL